MAEKAVYPDSKDGRFITRIEAKRRPATTERQHVPVRLRSKNRKK